MENVLLLVETFIVRACLDDVYRCKCIPTLSSSFFASFQSKPDKLLSFFVYKPTEFKKIKENKQGKGDDTVIHNTNLFDCGKNE